jgi:hypothetical protein
MGQWVIARIGAGGFRSALPRAANRRLSGEAGGREVVVSLEEKRVYIAYRLRIRPVMMLPGTVCSGGTCFCASSIRKGSGRPCPSSLASTRRGYGIPEGERTRCETVVAIDFRRREVIGGTDTVGEIEKSILSIMTFLLLPQGVQPMHCAANYGIDENDLAIFVGLSRTGKTTLSADWARILIGDGEHGWGDKRVFNSEGGCSTRAIRLSGTGEPAIHETTRTFGTILENVVPDPDTRQVACISHQASAATAPWHALSGFRSVGLLNVVSATPARPSVAKSSHPAPSKRLATNPGEKCRLTWTARRAPRTPAPA